MPVATSAVAGAVEVERDRHVGLAGRAGDPHPAGRVLLDLDGAERASSCGGISVVAAVGAAWARSRWPPRSGGRPRRASRTVTRRQYGERMAVPERPRARGRARSSASAAASARSGVPRSSSTKLVTDGCGRTTGGRERRREPRSAPRCDALDVRAHARLVAERRGHDRRRDRSRSSPAAGRRDPARSCPAARSRSRPAAPRARRPCDAVRTTTRFG